MLTISDYFLDVQDIFYTIQGEGPYAGIPAVFLRLAGCNLQCPTCDTDYTSKRQLMGFTDICHCIEKSLSHSRLNKTTVIAIPLLVITGGEPFRQVNNLVKFIQYVDNLVKKSYTIAGTGDGRIFANELIIQIETNGTVEISERLCKDMMTTHTVLVRFVCSPKSAIVPACYSEMYCDWKYVMNSGNVGEDGLPTTHLGRKQLPCRPPRAVANNHIYLQPEDSGDPEQNAANLAACVKSCMFYGYRLCVQIQKLAKLP